MRILILGLVALLFTVSVKAGESAFEFLERPGPHAVGLRVVEQYDATRRLGDGAWPLQTLVWYPAEVGSGKPFAYGNHMELGATTLSFGRPRKAEGFKAWFAEGLKHADVS